MMTRCPNGHQYDVDFGSECPVCMPTDVAYRHDAPGRTKVDPTHAASPAPTNAASPAPTQVAAGTSSKRIVGWVVVEKGPQREMDFRLYEGQNRVGRNAGSQVVLSDPLAGGAHAVINCEGGRFEIIDLASTNGTFLNDRPGKIIREELNSGDVIHIGDTPLKFIKRV